jgi:large subunit ribosomal protein L13
MIEMLIDATNMIVGRLGSVVAKKALLGERIDIVNAEKAVISGRKPVVLQRMKERVSKGYWSKGPHFKRAPDLLLKRMIRNMLPFKQPKGEAALKRIMCWIGVPEQFKDKKAETVEQARIPKIPGTSYVTIDEISRFLGGNVD